MCSLSYRVVSLLRQSSEVETPLKIKLDILTGIAADLDDFEFYVVDISVILIAKIYLSKTKLYLHLI